jgi:hypothetical protein
MQAKVKILVMAFLFFGPEIIQKGEAKQGKELVTEPFITLSAVPKRRFRFELGYSRYQWLNSITLSPGYEFTTKKKTFSLDFKFPFGVADTFLLGDIGLDFKWIVYQEPKDEITFSTGFNLTLPSVLLNTLGGDRGEIWLRRRKESIYGFARERDINLFPIRYLELGPFLVFSLGVWRLKVQADLGTIGIIACRFRNIYDSPHLEFGLYYDLALALRIYKDIMGFVFEINGLSILTDIAGPDSPQVMLLRENLVSGHTGVSLTPGLKWNIKNRFLLGIAFPVAIKKGEKKGRADLTLVYLHQWSFIFTFSLIL